MGGLHALGIFGLGLVSGGALIYSTRPKAVALESPPLQNQSDALAGKATPAQILQYGLPGPLSDLNVRTGYISGYDRRMRNPAWVAEHLTPERMAERGGNRGKSLFVEDESIPPKYRASLKDYARSGYDRGHQVPAADCKFSQQAMDETFALSNICPQVGEGFNRDYWAHFEDFCRRLTGKYQSVRIITGPLYLPRRDIDGKWRVTYEVIGNPASVAVPTHFFKVIVADQGNLSDIPAIGAFVLPNAPISNSTKLADFLVPLDAVERASGLDFLPRLPTARRKELCREVDCSIMVKLFDKQTQGLLASPKAKL